ncbi:hypothetical protein [Novosphingobium sp. SG707]|uniref:hypothetical protein n=1 Tax=Novosphingobium sp. SG707 TaxID=2586996 RepID=UPI001445A806|nr:hypothetical protein [Novosphingobium sp. SG707]NKJ00252.1 amino acid permease [Novosphingobium sp. SG707]
MTDARKVEKGKSLLHWYRHLVDLLSFVILACIVITAIYCVEIRMHYERSYIAAFVIGLICLAVMLIAWGQQVIAARDLATWRDMVELQIQSSRRKIARSHDAETLENHYFEVLVDSLISDIQFAVRDEKDDDGSVG